VLSGERKKYYGFKENRLTFIIEDGKISLSSIWDKFLIIEPVQILSRPKHCQYCFLPVRLIAQDILPPFFPKRLS
jgi:hypothetical protein